MVQRIKHIMQYSFSSVFVSHDDEVHYSELESSFWSGHGPLLVRDMVRVQAGDFSGCMQHINPMLFLSHWMQS